MGLSRNPSKLSGGRAEVAPDGVGVPSLAVGKTGLY